MARSEAAATRSDASWSAAAACKRRSGTSCRSASSKGLTVVVNLVADDAQDALIRAASESEMLVLGSRGLTPVESHFLGDISMLVVARAGRPVVLVRTDKRADGPGVRRRTAPSPAPYGPGGAGRPVPR
ncbi:universal stress protein [Streptomyces bobili]|uniref:universal stress protein n=1 Tax=Streptomyces bobili TaxID=67280 RepID=UPI0036F62301